MICATGSLEKKPRPGHYRDRLSQFRTLGRRATDFVRESSGFAAYLDRQGREKEPRLWAPNLSPASQEAKILQYGLAPVLQRLLHLVQELVSHRSVHYAVVVAKRYVAHRADSDGVVDDHGALLDGPEA